MLLSHRLFPGALFDSPSFPAKEMKSFMRHHAGPNVAFFHPTRGLLFFSAVFRRIWPEVRFFASISGFRDFLEGRVAPAERSHFDAFWKTFKKNDTRLAGQFVLKPGQSPDANTLGLFFFTFSAGRLLILLTGDTPKTVARDLEAIRSLDPWEMTTRLAVWVRDSEIECLVGHYLEHLPEEFRNDILFRRTVVDLFQETESPAKRLSYRFLKGRWHREIAPETTPPLRDEGRARHYGTLKEGTVTLNVTVFVGGVLPLGIAAFPAEALKGERLLRFQRFLHEVSNDLVVLGQTLVSGSFDFCRHWTGAGFALDALEEMAHLLDPARGRDLMFLPFWCDPAKVADLRTILDSVRYTTDLLFIDPKNGAGGLLLRNTDRETAEALVAEKFRRRLPSPVEDPVTVGEFLENR